MRLARAGVDAGAASSSRSRSPPTPTPMPWPRRSPAPRPRPPPGDRRLRDRLRLHGAASLRLPVRGHQDRPIAGRRLDGRCPRRCGRHRHHRPRAAPRRRHHRRGRRAARAALPAAADGLRHTGRASSSRRRCRPRSSRRSSRSADPWRTTAAAPVPRRATAGVAWPSPGTATGCTAPVQSRRFSRSLPTRAGDPARMTTERPAAWMTTARDLYLVAMAVFLVTILIGILNGADAVEFDRNSILTHVHSGTVGWLSLTIVASAFLLFRTADRRLMLALAVARAGLRPRLLLRQPAVPRDQRRRRCWPSSRGWWCGSGARTSARSAPCRGWRSPSGITSFGYGALFGVLIQVALATGIDDPARRPGRGARLGDDVRLPRAHRHGPHRVAAARHARAADGGLVQIGALFAGA